MLKIIKSRAMKIILVILLMGTVFFVFYKSFCTIKQIVDWNAISAIATALAVFVAIYIPQKERLETSKMDLFTQRFEVYYSLRKNLSDMYTSSFSTIDLEEVNLSIQKSFFLIEEKDKMKLDDIVQRVVDKTEENIKKNITTKVDSKGIEVEIDELKNVFEKYLDIRSYGLENQSIKK